VELKKDVAIQIERIRYTLPQTFLTKLIENFSKEQSIEEVYIYSQKANEEISTVLGVVLSDVSQAYSEAANLAFKNALIGENLEFPNFMIVLSNNEDLFQSVRAIQGALFYQK